MVSISLKSYILLASLAISIIWYLNNQIRVKFALFRGKNAIWLAKTCDFRRKTIKFMEFARYLQILAPKIVLNIFCMYDGWLNMI